MDCLISSGARDPQFMNEQNGNIKCQARTGSRSRYIHYKRNTVLRFRPGVVAQLCVLPYGASGRTDFCRHRYFEEYTGFYIVKIAVDLDGWRHERVRANAPHIGDNARMDISLIVSQSTNSPASEPGPTPRSCQPSE